MMKRLSLLALLALTGCDSRSGEPATAPSGAAPTASEPAQSPSSSNPSPSPAPLAAVVPSLPGLAFGQPLPAGTPWKAGPVQPSSECQIYTAPSVPDAYAIVVLGKLERVTFSQGATFRLPSGIGPGSTEAAVRQAYPDFVAEPHKYEAAPAKYLTMPHLRADQPGLRFEIGQNGKVNQLHIGLPSAIVLVEGCA